MGNRNRKVANLPLGDWIASRQKGPDAPMSDEERAVKPSISSLAKL